MTPHELLKVLFRSTLWAISIILAVFVVAWLTSGCAGPEKKTWKAVFKCEEIDGIHHCKRHKRDIHDNYPWRLHVCDYDFVPVYPDHK